MLLTFLVSLCLGLRFEYSLDWRRDLKLAQVEVGHLLFVQVVLLLQNRTRLFLIRLFFL